REGGCRGAGEGQLVARGRGGPPRHPGGDRGLPRRDLTLPGLDDVSHDRVLGLVWFHAGPLEGGPDRDRAKVDRAERRETAAELGDGGPRAGDEGRAGRVKGGLGLAWV